MQVNRKTPGCFVFLLDQSASMSQPMLGAEKKTKAQALADIVNELLQSIVMRSFKSRNEPPRHYFDIGLIGYGTGARPLFSGALAGRLLASVAEVAAGKIRVDRDADGHVQPIWFDPVASGVTHMCAALDLAGKIVEGWTNSHPESGPPIIVNITDGYATDGDPVPVSRRITSGGTNHGSTLLFNIALSSSEATTVAYPSTDHALTDERAKALFQMSSPLPPLMRQYAAELGADVQDNARGFVYNADLEAMIQAIDVGTRT
ncbi:vWA domain-containing protein [Micromonospora sp. NPDC049523]|uniref:vWA domain-containing protein n=1 Tax=Micromonospora sp. NPDC049523 TaxID=3155921 RepID=UPI003432FBC2